MDRERMIEVLKKDRDLAMFNPMTGECVPMNEDNAESAEALSMAIAALEGKDVDVPTNSALDHIHNVVAEREYQRGYEQGKAETNCPEIPDSWIPIKAHPATDEERESHPDIDYWLDCEMPDDGQEILVTVKHKNWIGVEKDVCYVDSEYSLDSGYDWDDIIAWMPLPEPWKGEG